MTKQSKTMQELLQESYLAAGNAGYIEDLYETYLNNPHDVAPEWRHYFDNLLRQSQFTQPEVSHSAVQEQFLQLARQSARTLSVQGMQTAFDKKQEKVLELIDAYRRVGHLKANIDPLGMRDCSSPVLDISYYGLSSQDLQTTYSTGSFASLNKSQATLQEILQGLQRVYSGTIGFEYMHIDRTAETVLKKQ
jgi:2-oxoglutarate dehydrogenase E1 component